jgi:hypothetical protein
MTWRDDEVFGQFLIDLGWALNDNTRRCMYRAWLDSRAHTLEECAAEVEHKADNYPEHVFPELTVDEREHLHEEHRGVLDRMSAGMARHCAQWWAKCIRSLLQTPEEGDE